MSTIDDPRLLDGPPLPPGPARATATTGWLGRLGRGLRRLTLLTLMGLVLAGIVHILAVLLIPALAERDAASAYASLGNGGHAELVTPAPTGLPVMAEADPSSVSAVCSYDLGTGPVRVIAHIGSLPLGLTLHRRGGGVVYAITDRAAIRGVLEFVVMTQEQLDERLAQDEEGETSRELRVVSSSPQGLIVARVMLRRQADRSEAEALATSVACGPAD